MYLYLCWFDRHSFPPPHFNLLIWIRAQDHSGRKCWLTWIETYKNDSLKNNHNLTFALIPQIWILAIHTHIFWNHHNTAFCSLPGQWCLCVHGASPWMIPCPLGPAARPQHGPVSPACSARLQRATVVSAPTEGPLSSPADVEQPKH